MVSSPNYKWYHVFIDSSLASLTPDSWGLGLEGGCCDGGDRLWLSVGDVADTRGGGCVEDDGGPDAAAAAAAAATAARFASSAWRPAAAAAGDEGGLAPSGASKCGGGTRDPGWPVAGGGGIP